MSLIYLTRHAQSTANADHSVYGTMPNCDIPLSEKGIIDASKAGMKILDHHPSIRESGLSVFSSPYKRAIHTAEIIAKEIGGAEIKSNLLLVERQFGEQEGCSDVEDFSTRPMERKAINTAGYLWYKPYRGESLMELYQRTALFFVLQNKFGHIPVSVISSHMSTCQMFHALFTNEMPNHGDEWANCEIRKYEATDSMTKYLGTI